MTLLVEKFVPGEREKEMREILRIPSQYFPDVMAEHPQFPPYLLVNPGRWAIPFCEGRDFLQVHTGLQPFMFLDDMVDYAPYLAEVENISKQYEVGQFTPVAYVDTSTEASVEKWIDGISIKNGYKRGDKYQRLRISTRRIGLEEMIESKTHSWTHKLLAYPDFRTTGFRFLDARKGAEEWWWIEIVEDDGWVASGAAFIVDDVLYLPYIDLTDDLVLRQRHRASIVIHMAAARLAQNLGMSRANFGLYYPYKRIMNCPTEGPNAWNTGIRHLVEKPLPEGYVPVHVDKSLGATP